MGHVDRYIIRNKRKLKKLRNSHLPFTTWARDGFSSKTKKPIRFTDLDPIHLYPDLTFIHISDSRYLIRVTHNHEIPSMKFEVGKGDQARIKKFLRWHKVEATRSHYRSIHDPGDTKKYNLFAEWVNDGFPAKCTVRYNSTDDLKCIPSKYALMKKSYGFDCSISGRVYVFLLKSVSQQEPDAPYTLPHPRSQDYPGFVDDTHRVPRE